MSTWPRNRDGLAWGTALAIVFVAGHLLVATLSDDHDYESALIFPVMAAVIAAQLGLSAIWMAFGSSPISIRATCFAMTAAFPATLWLSEHGVVVETEAFVNLLKLLLTILTVPTSFLALRLAGFDVTHSGLPSRTALTGRPRRRFMGHVLLLVAWLAAAIVGICEFSGIEKVDSAIEWPPLSTAVALGLFFAILAQTRVVMRIGIYLAVGVVVGIALKQMGDENASVADCLTEACITTAIVASVLFLFRRLGYRLAWIGWSSAPSAALQNADDGSGASEAPTLEESEPNHLQPRGRPFFVRLPQQFWASLRRTAPLVWLLLGAIVAIDAATLYRRESNLLVLLSVSEACLIGVWAGLGATPGLIRIPLGASAVAALSLAIWDGKELDWSSWFGQFVILGTATATTAFGLLALQAFGVRLICASPRDSMKKKTGEPFQFSIRQAIFAMTQAGVFMALLKLACQAANADAVETLTSVAGCTLFGPFAIAATALAIGRRWALVRVVALVALSGATLLVLCYSQEIPSEQMPAVIGYCFVLGSLFISLIAGPLAVFRVCGYRFERRSKASKPRVARLSPDSGTAQLSLK